MKKSVKIMMIVLPLVLFCILFPMFYYKVNYIGKEKVKNIVADHMSVKESTIYFDSVDFEWEKEIYEVDLYYQNKEYEFKVDAKQGTVIYTDYKKGQEENLQKPQITSKPENGMNETSPTPNTKITMDQAKQIVLDHAELTNDQVTFFKQKEEIEDGISVYEFDFYYQDMEYEYQVKASDGTIIEFDKDKRR